MNLKMPPNRGCPSNGAMIMAISTNNTTQMRPTVTSVNWLALRMDLAIEVHRGDGGSRIEHGGQRADHGAENGRQHKSLDAIADRQQLANQRREGIVVVMGDEFFHGHAFASLVVASLVTVR